MNYKEPHLFYTPPSRYRDQFLDPQKHGPRIQHLNQDAFRFMAGQVPMDQQDFDLLRALYDGEIRYLDDCLRELFTFLKGQGHLENSLIIVTSDHGENIGEHSLMDHQYCVYDTLVRVPLLCIRAGDFGCGVTVSEQVQLHDVFPTVLDLLGIYGDPRAQNEAQSLLRAQPRAFTVVEYLSSAQHVMARRFPDIDLMPFRRTFRAIRTEQYKFIHASDGQHELYDIVADPGEKQNLLTTHAEIAQTLEWTLNEWVQQKRAGDWGEAVSSEFDQDIEERLRDLGYL